MANYLYLEATGAFHLTHWGVSGLKMNRCVLAAVEISGVSYPTGMGAIAGYISNGAMCMCSCMSKSTLPGLTD